MGEGEERGVWWWGVGVCREGSLPHELAIDEETKEKNRLVGLVVKASASRAGGPGFESHLHRDFFGVELYQ